MESHKNDGQDSMMIEELETRLEMTPIRAIPDSHVPPESPEYYCNIKNKCIFPVE